MGDPLSIAASVAGLITISAQIVGMAKQIFDKVKDAPETMMRVREEVESMQPMFCQVQLLLSGSGSRPSPGNLSVISLHKLMTTLTGCIIVYTKLEKKMNEVCGFNDPTTASVAWKKAGVIAGRAKWGLWRHEEVLCIIEDLQRQKLGLNLMLTIITSTTTVEASEVQARLEEILQSSHAHSALLRDLIHRQDAALNRLGEQAEEIRLNTNPPPSGTGTASSTVSTRLPTDGSPSDGHHHCDFDNASIISKRSTFSLRSGRPSYMEDLKASRAYKRLRHFGLGFDASSGSVLSFQVDSACSTGNWSMSSHLTFGDLSASQIAVSNLPIDLAAVSNPEPFPEASSSSTETHRSRTTFRRIWSSRERIHNAIENGNEFIVRALLAIGMDIEELDSNGQTPLVHAALKRQGAICKLLLKKGARLEPLKAFTSGIDITERSKLLIPLIYKAMYDCSGSATVLRLLVQMTDSVGDDIEGQTLLAHVAEYFLNSDNDNYKFWDSILKVLLDKASTANIEIVKKIRPKFKVWRCSMQELIDKDYKSILLILSLTGSQDVEAWTPLASAAFNNNEALCEFLVEKGCTLFLDIEQRKKLKPNLSCRIHDAAQHGHKTALQLLLTMGADINEKNINFLGSTALLEAVLYDHLPCVKILIERGADVTALTTKGSNILHCAALSSTASEMIRFLLDDIVETRKLVDGKDPDGDTPLHYCSLGSGGQVKIAKMLVQAGATLTKNNRGKTPYEFARYQKTKQLAKYLWSQLPPEQQVLEIPPPPHW